MRDERREKRGGQKQEARSQRSYLINNFFLKKHFFTSVCAVSLHLKVD